MTSPSTTYYYDYIYPLDAVTFLTKNKTGDLSLIETPVDPASREWFSQPRASDDFTEERITTVFRQPVVISDLTIDVLKVPSVLEVWFQDRLGNWRALLDSERIPLRVNVGRSDVKEYYTYHSDVSPVVAKQVQFRVTRVNDGTMGTQPYVVGLRNALIRRNIYDRSAGLQGIEDDVDILGNVVSKEIKDWDAGKAVDDRATTFWRSAPLPDPLGVTSLYLDVRTDDGKPRLIDKIYIDPIYNGQMLNLYYTRDDTVGRRHLLPNTIKPDIPETDVANVTQKQGVGLTPDQDIGILEAYYRITMKVGPLVSQDSWLGVEWVPDFASDGTVPSHTPVLFNAVATAPQQAFKPQMYYDLAAKKFVLQFYDGTTTITYDAPISVQFAAGDSLRMIIGWSYGPDQVHIHVRNQRGVDLVNETLDVTDLPANMSVDGAVEIRNFAGTVRAHVLKLESWALGYNGGAVHAFQAAPTYYVNPDPIINQMARQAASARLGGLGDTQSSSLDNAVYAVDWMNQKHGSGGASPSAYSDKEWTPIWRDYLTLKGFLIFPQAVNCKYLKLEFTNLTEVPYPIYEPGIKVTYNVYPTSVMQQAGVGPRVNTGQAGFVGSGTFISMTGVKSVNWLNPDTVQNAVGTNASVQSSPVVINAGPGFVDATLPNDPTGQVVNDSARVEAASDYVYRRDAQQSFLLAQNAYSTLTQAEAIQAITPNTDVDWADIAASAPGTANQSVRSTGVPPVRGADWWVFPGQTLKLPATVMQRLTDTDTVTERKLTTEYRLRFNATGVHRYEQRTVRRDAAVAYFAGIRDIIPFTSTFIAGEDKPFFDFALYDPDQWVQTNITQTDAGPVTTAGQFYNIENELFRDKLLNWGIINGTWNWDGTAGHWGWGMAVATAANRDTAIQSTKFSVVPSNGIGVSCWAKWSSLVVNNTHPGLSIGVDFYDASDGFLETQYAREITFADWSGHTVNDWTLLSGNVTVPAHAAWGRIRLSVRADAISGTVSFDYVRIWSLGTEEGTLFKDFMTMSTFSKAAVDFRDSGLVRSDSMWADINPDSQSIDDLKLAPYVDTVPDVIPGGMWGDTLKAWGAADTQWGAPFGVVSITIDGNRRYQGKRVLHFRRVAGAGEAGILVNQSTNYVSMGLFRIGAVLYKPTANNNEITVRLRRLSDGVFVYEETLSIPTGLWYNFTSRFVEIPDSPDQEYAVYLTLSGDEEDDLFLSDLYTEIANIRYFVRLGGTGAFQHEVTDLRYAPQSTVYVTSTLPVNEMAVTATILSPKAYCFGCTVTPTYLK